MCASQYPECFGLDTFFSKQSYKKLIFTPYFVEEERVARNSWRAVRFPQQDVMDLYLVKTRNVKMYQSNPKVSAHLGSNMMLT